MQYNPLSNKSIRATHLLFAGAFVATMLSCYPVVFFGRSFVSPQFFGVPLLYDRAPYLPGGSSTAPNEDVHGADVGASPWATQPWSEIESRALLNDGEFPLWNRFNSAGLPLLGQGISMLGDPLHVLPLIGNGSAWSWDLKFILAKFLFVFANALIVFHITRSRAASLLVSASTAFIGFFLFRINHPGFFSLCYGPWILLAWLKLSDLAPGKKFVGWLAVLVVATISELASGAIKEAVALLIVLHLTGSLCFATATRPLRDKINAGVPLLIAGVATVLLSYPLWASFLFTLSSAETFSDVPHVRVLPLTRIGAVFDDLLNYRVSLQHFPTLNLFLGFGVVWGLVYGRWRRNRTFAVMMIGAAFAISVGYGIFPPSIVKEIPLIGNMHNVFIEFSYLLIVLLISIAGYGYAAFFVGMRFSGFYRKLGMVGAIFALLVALVFTPNQNLTFDSIGYPVSVVYPDLMPFVIVALLCMAIAVPIFLRQIVINPYAKGWAIALAAVGLVIVHARNGMQLESGWRIADDLLLNPGPRPDFSKRSPALDALQSNEGDPYRSIGMGANLFPGYNAAINIEGIGGADPLPPRSYIQLLHAFNFHIGDEGWRVIFDENDVRRLSDALNFLNVRYVFTASGTAANFADYSLVAHGDLDIVARPNAWPRAFWTDKVSSYRSLDDIATLLKAANGNVFAAIQTGNDASIPAELKADGAKPQIVKADRYRLTNNTTVFHIVAPKMGLVVLNEGYAEGFEVMVDGMQSPIFRVNQIYKAVVVDGGEHNVAFIFNPPYWRRSPYVAGIGLIVLGIALIGSWRGTRRRHENAVVPELA